MKAKPPDLGSRYTSLEDEGAGDSPLVAQQIADGLGGPWYAFKRGDNDPRRHFVLHTEDHPGSELYANSYGGHKWEWGVGHIATREAEELPGWNSARPLCRLHCNTSKSRTPNAIAADVRRRLLPAAVDFWECCEVQQVQRVAAWARYLATIEAVHRISGTDAAAPTLERLKRYPHPDEWTVTADPWSVEIRCSGVFDITRHGRGHDELLGVLAELWPGSSHIADEPRLEVKP